MPSSLVCLQQLHVPCCADTLNVSPLVALTSLDLGDVTLIHSDCVRLARLPALASLAVHGVSLRLVSSDASDVEATANAQDQFEIDCAHAVDVRREHRLHGTLPFVHAVSAVHFMVRG